MRVEFTKAPESVWSLGTTDLGTDGKRFRFYGIRCCLSSASHIFHSVQFWGRDGDGNRVGPYSGWDDDHADLFLENLLCSVEHSEVRPFGSAIVVNEWKRFPIEHRKWLTGAVWNGHRFKTSGCPNKPYFVPFQLSVIEAARFNEAIVHHFFGLDKSFSGHANQMYKEIKKLKTLPERDKLGNISFPLSRDIAGLQAADLLHRFYRHCKARLGKESAMPPILTRLTSRELPGQRYGLIRTADLNRMVEISAAQHDAKMRSIHEAPTCVACRRAQNQPPLQLNSGHFEGTSHRGTGTKSHTVFRYGQYIESEFERTFRGIPVENDALYSTHGRKRINGAH